MKLTDAELDQIQALNDDVFRNGSEVGSTAEALCRHVDRVLAELRSLRALLATPYTPGEDEPSPYKERRVLFAFSRAEHVIDADRAIALGAALIRAALAAKEGSRGA